MESISSNKVIKSLVKQKRKSMWCTTKKKKSHIADCQSYVYHLLTLRQKSAPAPSCCDPQVDTIQSPRSETERG